MLRHKRCAQAPAPQAQPNVTVHAMPLTCCDVGAFHCCLQAAHTQLASREGRISQPLLARMAQHLLARQPAAANQGWVMEGWMRSLAAAQLLTCSAAGGMTAAEKAANRRTTGGSVKVCRLRLGDCAWSASQWAMPGLHFTTYSKDLGQYICHDTALPDAQRAHGPDAFITRILLCRAWTRRSPALAQQAAAAARRPLKQPAAQAAAHDAAAQPVMSALSPLKAAQYN